MKHAYLIAVVLAILGSFFFLHKHSTTSCSNPGKAIVVTGVSSSGKTSVAKALQSFYAEKDIPFFLVHSDEFLENLPRRWVDFDQKDPSSIHPDGLVFETVITNEGTKKIQHAGPLIDKMRTATAHVIKALACNGVNVIYEGVIEAESLHRGLEEIKPIQAQVVLATAPIEVIEQRERNRQGVIGLARGQSEEPGFYDERLYDVTVDTSSMAPNEAAKYIHATLK